MAGASSAVRLAEASVIPDEVTLARTAISFTMADQLSMTRVRSLFAGDRCGTANQNHRTGLSSSPGAFLPSRRTNILSRYGCRAVARSSRSPGKSGLFAVRIATKEVGMIGWKRLSRRCSRALAAPLLLTAGLSAGSGRARSQRQGA
jgi:hypothetical protein